MFPPFRKRQPPWIYEALPLIYAATGVATILVLQNAMAYFAGLVLMAAAAVATWMRASARFGLEGAIRREPPAGSLMRVTLGPEHQSGDPAIDLQHRDLCAVANLLLDHATRGGAVADAEPILIDLRDELKRHFADEERLIAERAPELLADHAAAHRALSGRLRQLIEASRRGHLAIGTIVEFVTADLVTGHIAREDHHFFARIQKPAP